ncbi:unnamed protein product [Mytilus coruscus]|uniref:DZIP3-like HEPN domain-containing protein n=1 Tax=Mytilus coruscus TaxID=42192 RepID=A0A6J8A992_MYTCO|nr:unnamed protein product [Mytilus coruscus]
MATQDSDNYFKIVALIVEIACSVIWKYMKQNVFGSTSFESFLNLKKVKHKLVHVYEQRECCDCVSDKIKGERLIAKQQLLVLYKSDETKQIQSHKKYVRGKVTKICICNYYAKENIDVKVVDITLANYIIQKCGKGEKGLDNWMKQIQELRNEIFHLSDIKELKDDEFIRKWEILQGSILGIANLIDKEYVEETKKKIIHTKQLAVISEYMLNYEILCRDYWKNKCAEFERAECNEIEKKANALHTQFPRIFTESMKEDCQTTTKEIQNFKTFIDKINILTKVFGNQETLEILTNAELVEEDWQSIHVPAFLQLNVPTSWDKTKIFEYLEDMRLSGTSDANIRIMNVSRDDLNMYTTMARTVIGNVDSLKRVINTILSGMLSEVAIDTTKMADVSVNLKIPGNRSAETIYDEEMKTIFDKENSEIDSEDEVKKTDKLSAIHDRKTNTRDEFVEENNEIDSEDGVKKADELFAIHDRKTKIRDEFDDSKQGCILLDISVSSSVQADDIALLSTTEKRMQHLINICQTYSESWAFKFSPTKSDVLHYSKKNKSVSINLTLYDDIIPLVTSAKHVGILLNCKLRSMDQTLNACRVFRATALSVLNSGIHPSILNPLACSKIILQIQICYSKALYGCELWNNLTQTELTMLERSHRFVCKIVQGLPKRTRSDNCTSLLGWFSVETIINRCKLLFFGRLCRLKSSSLPKRIMISRLMEFKHKCVPEQLGFIPDIYKAVEKYNMTDYIVMLQILVLSHKKNWSVIVNWNIEANEETWWLYRISGDNDFYMFRHIHSAIKPHKTWTISKQFPELRVSAKYVIDLCSVVRYEDEHLLCDKCGKFFLNIVEHVLVSCDFTQDERDDLWQDIINVNPIQFSVLWTVFQHMNSQQQSSHAIQENSDMNSEYGVEKADDLSAVHDSKTRTKIECVEENSEMNSIDVVVKPENNSSAFHCGNTRTKAELVDMAPTEKKNYFKLVTLLVDIGCHVIWTYIGENILGPRSFESFLNLIKEKHKLIHVYETNECCECVSELIKGEKLISRKQLLLLYKSDESKQIENHKTCIGRKVVQVCICKYVAIKNIDVKIIDITLANYIICKCGKQEPGLDNWMTQIKEVRNEIFHISDIQGITDDKFSRKWEKVKGAILGIAKLINSTFVEETEEKIQHTKSIICIPEFMLKYEILCRDYWRNKCAEFERAEIQNFQNKAEALHIQYPKVGSKSLERDNQKTVEEIRNIKTNVDNINVLIKVLGKEQDLKTSKDKESVNKDCQRVFVPAFLQLVIPNSWNRTKVLEYLDGMRLNRTSDMNIRIIAVSPDDLNSYSEIARTVLQKVELLKDELKTLMSGILSKAEIDPKQSDDVVVSVTIPDITESVPFKSYFKFDVNLRQKLELASERNSLICDCIITNDQLVFTETFHNRLLFYNLNGSFNREIKLSSQPEFISVINDRYVAVSYNRGFIETININTRQVKKKIKIRCDLSGGISYQNGLIYVVINRQEIDVINMTGEITQSFHSPFQSPVLCLSTDTDILFLADPLVNTLYCCDLNGSERWNLIFDKMSYPCGGTTDRDGNVYVVCYKSNNVVVVSSDGKYYKELLTEKDGLHNPTGIYYEKSKDCLLVCNGGNGYAFLFDVKHSAKIKRI